MKARPKAHWWGVAALFVAACQDEGEPQGPQPIPKVDAGWSPSTGADGYTGTDAAVNTDSGTAITAMPGVSCRPVQGEPLPARDKILQGVAAQAGGVMVTTSDLFGAFDRQCGACHGANPTGNKWSVPNESVFVAVDMQEALARLKTDDPNKVMPRGGDLLRDRPENSAMAQFAKRFEAWLNAGKPSSMADPLAPSTPVDNTMPFALSRELGEALTNIGSCVPAKEIVGTDSAQMDALDAKFASLASLEELPQKLSETDLFTLDSAALARRGVISYAPGYPLWSDDAGKMRYVRVPRGQSIKFSAVTQSLEIPDNTRFYKTFLKEVKDVNGRIGHRKIETRLIIARRGQEKGEGLPQINALYGTYAWNEDETEAELVTATYKNDKPFRDQVILYTKDEQVEQALQQDPNNQIFLEDLYFKQGARRHYAIPGAERCVQCHLGGPGGTFVLGFLPLQVMRRPVGEAGVIEPAAADELTQLERLIDYGVITGIDSPGQITPFENAQGPRSARNNYELTAQGYMLGNCAHCHNPQGYPTRVAPVLKDLLNFMPSPDGGGVFAFPLDRVSPRIQRHLGPDATSTLEMPYITPSPYDNKYTQQPYLLDMSTADLAESVDLTLVQSINAPWRSLIYRNVDTPFTYSDHDVIYPHMPMNTAGYDCRARRILGEWMLAVPARPKDGISLPAERDDRVQPFEEVAPDDPSYSKAQLAADARVSSFRQSERYRECPDTSDIIDPKASDGAGGVLNLADASRYEHGVPNRPHWVEVDTTQIPGWLPRNPLWRSFLVDNDFSSLVQDVVLDGNTDAFTKRREDLIKYVRVLQTVRFSEEIRDFALNPVPYGLWQERPGCTFPGIQTVAETPSDPNWSWLEGKRNLPDQHVYTQAPGAAIFGMVCVNCHGPGLDAKGRQADTVAQLSGGKTIVANFRDGLFGPTDSPRQHREGEFVASGAEVDDWAARYLAWMALGGTTARIPSAVLSVVGSNPVLGVPVNRGVEASSNMLSVGRTACALFLPALTVHDVSEVPTANRTRKISYPKGHFVTENGDYDLWKRVCSFQNPVPIRVFTFVSGAFSAASNQNPLDKLEIRGGLYHRTDEGGASVYPVDAPVVDQNGDVKYGVSDDNTAPWCIKLPLTDEQVEAAQKAVDDDAAESGMPPIPFCPPELFEFDPNTGREKYKLTADDEFAWVHRGVVNAGFSVYAYVDAVTAGKVTPKPEYDDCEKLEPAAMQ